MNYAEKDKKEYFEKTKYCFLLVGVKNNRQNIVGVCLTEEDCNALIEELADSGKIFDYTIQHKIPFYQNVLTSSYAWR